MIPHFHECSAHVTRECEDLVACFRGDCLGPNDPTTVLECAPCQDAMDCEEDAALDFVDLGVSRELERRREEGV